MRIPRQASFRMIVWLVVLIEGFLCFYYIFRRRESLSRLVLLGPCAEKRPPKMANFSIFLRKKRKKTVTFPPPEVSDPTRFLDDLEIK